MDSDYVCALDGILDMILIFDFNSFTNKDITTHKVQYVVASILFSKVSQTWN